MAAATEPTRRLIQQGSVVGLVQKNGSYAWLGIPFAKPPVGVALAPPQAPERFSAQQAGPHYSRH